MSVVLVAGITGRVGCCDVGDVDGVAPSVIKLEIELKGDTGDVPCCCSSSSWAAHPHPPSQHPLDLPYCDLNLGV